MTDALKALREVDFNWVRPLGSIWLDATGNVEGPNDGVVEQIAEALFRETLSPQARPNGRVLVGQSGIGKTHLIGNLRRQVWQKGGWFVLLDVLGLADFWRSAALSFLSSLTHQMPDGRQQVEAVIAGAARACKAEEKLLELSSGPRFDLRDVVNILLDAMSRLDMGNTLKHQDVFRALFLLSVGDFSARSLAHAWLQGYDADEQARAALGFRGPPPAPVELVRGVSWIMSLSGPTLVALDQIDGVVNPATTHQDDDLNGEQGLAPVLAAGLLELHDVRHRGMTAIACLFSSWLRLEEKGLAPFRQRFPSEPIALQGLNSAAAVEGLIVNRLVQAYAAAFFSPPFASSPFSRKAIEGAAAAGMMPRTILMRCDAWRRSCIERGEVVICDDLTKEIATVPVVPSSNGFDADFEHLRAAADISGLIMAGEDEAFGALLRHVFDLYTRHLPLSEAIDVESRADPAQKIPPLHGRLTFTFHDQKDRELHYCFRALEHSNAIAFQSRLRAALTASGLSSRIPERHLLLVRRGGIPGGAKTGALFDAFEKAGGQTIAPSDDDLRVFVALRAMSEQAAAKGDGVAFEAWLQAKTPLLTTAFFKEAGLNPPPLTPDAQAPHKTAPIERQPELPLAADSAKAPDTAPNVTRPVPSSSTTAVAEIPIGRRLTPEAEPVHLATKLLPRHTAIIAGSGSGKTVLLRRMVEEAALAGIPAIVIDPNNDLSRLGDPWPERPSVFTAEDDAKAGLYRDRVEVVVWTPNISAGNPLFLSVMPDFAGIGDDRDQRVQTIEMAAATLAPLAGIKNQSANAALQRGVLADALRFFAAGNGGDLSRFIGLLDELPEAVSSIGHAGKIAAGMADQLRAAVSTNPLLRADGPVVDPQLLFFGPDAGRVRISVINLSGLASDEAKEDFVNRLQMTLFGWIKKHPSAGGLLYVVDEAQNFMPSGRAALSSASGLKLVAQARKYGLGMIVATQAPRGIHNQIVSNCTTQFFGRQGSSATISAAQEMIAASGGRADDIGKLTSGQFYFATEGSGKPARIMTPLCLSWHPANPPPPEEVIARAARYRNALPVAEEQPA